MIRRVHHVGIAAKSLEESLRFWSDALGMRVAGTETVESEGVRVAFLPAGDARIEILEATRRGFPDRALPRQAGGGDPPPDPRGRRRPGDARPAPSARRADARRRAARGGGWDPRRLPPPARHRRRPRGARRAARGAARIPPRPRGSRPGQPVLAYLREPSEKVWGVLRRLDAYGLEIEGVDLTSFDDWVVQVQRGEEAAVGPSTWPATSTPRSSRTTTPTRCRRW